VSRPDALKVADRLRRIIASTPCSTPPGAAGGPLEIPVSISLGVAGLPGDGDSDDSLIAAADSALYQAKRLGRNQVVMSGALFSRVS
jgi:diguanylate cyclase (GGDEF)-like protein